MQNMQDSHLGQAPAPRPPRKLWKWILGFFAAAFVLNLLVGFIRAAKDETQGSQTSQPKRDEIANCSPSWVDGQATSDALLDASRDGKDTSAYWAPGQEMEALFAVRDYKFLQGYRLVDEAASNGTSDQKPNPDKQMYGYVYRISSSTKGGFPITKDWMIKEVAIGKECYVTGLEEWPR